MALWPIAPPHLSLPVSCSSDTPGKGICNLLQQQPEATCARCVLQVLREGESLWRHQAETWRSKVNCQPHSQSCMWSGSWVPVTGANVLLQPLTDATGSKPRNFFEGDSRGNYSCHPKLVIYVFTQAEILERCWPSLRFASFQTLCVSPPTPSPQVLQRKGHLLSVSLAFGRFFHLGLQEVRLLFLVQAIQVTMKYCMNSAVMSSQAKYFLQLSRLIPILFLFLSRHLAQELSGYPWKLFACSI